MIAKRRVPSPSKKFAQSNDNAAGGALRNNDDSKDVSRWSHRRQLLTKGSVAVFAVCLVILLFTSSSSPGSELVFEYSGRVGQSHHNTKEAKKCKFVINVHAAAFDRS